MGTFMGKMKKNKKSESRHKVLFPIGVKLALIIGLIVLVSLGLVTYLNSYFIGQDVRRTAEDANLSTNVRIAKTVEDKLATVRSNVFQLLDLRNAAGNSSQALASQAEVFFFERNPDIAAVNIMGYGSDASRNQSILNQQFFITHEADPSVLDLFLQTAAPVVRRSCAGETVATNPSPFFALPMMTVFFPYKENGFDQTCAITFSLDSILEIISSNSTNTSFLINDSDELLVHPLTERILRGESMRNYPLVRIMRTQNKNGTDSRQIPFEDPEAPALGELVTSSLIADIAGEKKLFSFSAFVEKVFTFISDHDFLIKKLGNLEVSHKDFYGAYCKISVGDISVLTTVPLAYILEGVETTRRNNIYLTLVVFFLSIIAILFFGRYAISRHLRRLTIVADKIQSGNFDLEERQLKRLSSNRLDEIGVLNQSTKDELDFLNTFARFTNKNVAKAIARKEIDFEPHLKDITIFFSDIRGFTSISDGFNKRFGDDSPKEIINFLNDYMARMVECVSLSGGNIDKFEGDAIMAVWGLMREDSLEFEHLPEGSPVRLDAEKVHLAHVKQDALNAVMGTIAMRYALMKYNKDAMEYTAQHENEARASFKPYIRIGCGINTGRATCGIMGGSEKMEYTAIGDSVNFASRTESSNKACGTDILFTEATYNMLKDEFIKNPSNNFTIREDYAPYEIVVERIPVDFDVKGKGIQHFYGVVNMPAFDVEAFFRRGNPDFVADPDCLKAVGPDGPTTLDEVREMLGIPTPDFAKVNLNAEENKVQVRK